MTKEIPDRTTLYDAIHTLSEKVKRLRRRIKELEQKINIEGNGVMLTVQNVEFQKLVRTAFNNTIRAHSTEIKGRWIESFTKRLWGAFKNTHHNKIYNPPGTAISTTPQP